MVRQIGQLSSAIHNHLSMAAFARRDALPIPQQHDANERFGEDEYQH
jgi:hypothetical protein